ncbi:DnaJ domain-containing protein [Nocardioides dilutus]
MNTPGPSWYDVLGVEPEASAEDIRAAWKAGIAELDPTDRQFRLLNQAAEVLLDPVSRQSYDESLAEPEPAPAKTEAKAEVEIETDPGRTSSKGVPAWLLAGLGVVAAVLIGLCVWQAGEPTDAQVKEATTDAQAAAERAIVAIVSYDYRSLEDDQTKASAYMTDDFKKDYEALFAVIRENAPETKTVLTTEVVASGVVRSGDDRVQIFMFIDNPRTNAEITTPEIQRNQVTVTMEQVGDEWLVDDLKTTLPAA